MAGRGRARQGFRCQVGGQLSWVASGTLKASCRAGWGRGVVCECLCTNSQLPVDVNTYAHGCSQYTHEPLGERGRHQVPPSPPPPPSSYSRIHARKYMHMMPTCSHLVNMKGTRWPRCSASLEGPCGGVDGSTGRLLEHAPGPPHPGGVQPSPAYSREQRPLRLTASSASRKSARHNLGSPLTATLPAHPRCVQVEWLALSSSLRRQPGATYAAHCKQPTTNTLT